MPTNEDQHYLVKPTSIILYSLFIVCLAVISYYYIDRPVAEWTYNNTSTHQYHFIWQYATHLAPLCYVIAPWIFFYIAYLIHKDKPIKVWHKIFMLMVLSMGVTILFNEQLKFIFGRYWPSTWYYGNLSWIHNKAYGFTWFKNNHSFKSFPSGHTSLICGFMMVLWWLRDSFKIRLFVATNCLMVGLGLILMCHHFVSDVLIGSLVGVLVSYITVYKAHSLELFNDIYK